MTLMRWDPFTELRRMEENMNRLWRGFTSDGGNEAWALPLDVMEEGDNIVIHASVPGVKPENINVMVENNVLTIRAETKEEKEGKEGDYLMRERRFGSFYRSLRLPDTVDTERAKTTYENGVLKLSFPKMESKKAKQLKVNVPNEGKVLESKE
ncbi:MAG: Hsp20/alpha crystallin family protein [SAR202 cluster bacterium]|nr:Hsp20/alpha crystallin family protein [SAR202 cluster bacterium]